MFMRFLTCWSDLGSCSSRRCRHSDGGGSRTWSMFTTMASKIRIAFNKSIQSLDQFIVEISSLVTLMWIFIGIKAINSGHTMAYNLMVRMYDVIHLKLQYKPFLEENVNFTYFYFKLFSFLSRHKTTWIEGSKTTNLLNMMFDVWPWAMCWVIKWVVLGKFEYC